MASIFRNILFPFFKKDNPTAIRFANTVSENRRDFYDSREYLWDLSLIHI